MVNVPVYSNENSVHFINIYTEDEDGTFRRTQDEPLRLLRDDIQGISPVQGEMVSHKYDRQSREWSEPTISFHYGRPQSFHHFLRENLSKNKFYVFSKPSLSGRLSKFHLHQLQLKTSVSQRKISILKEKYCLSTGLWSNTEHEQQTQSVSQANNANLANNNKILRGGEAVGVKNDHDLPRNAASALINNKPDIDVADFKLNSVRGMSSEKPVKNQQNSHFILRFLFNRE